MYVPVFGDELSFDVTPFVCCDLALGRLMFALYVFFLAFDGVSFFAHIDVRVVARCLRCLLDRYCSRDAVLVDGHRMLLNANADDQTVCPRNKFSISSYIRTIRVICFHREW